jgi:hypothetical protein
MTDTTTRDRLKVATDGGAGPYIMVPVTQFDAVRSLLDGKGVSYWLDDEVISVDGKPEIAVINLAPQSDPVTVQRLLDMIR